MLIFLHMHKCAGSTVVRKARQAGLVLPEHNHNGNLVKPNGRNLRYETMDADAVRLVLERQASKGVEFFAIEWDFPPVEYFRCDVSIDLFTVLRDPFARAVSNYRFAKLSGSVHKDVVFQELMNWSYSKAGPLARSANYYTRKLCSELSLAPIGESHLKRAAEVLDAFKSVIVLERDDLDLELERLGMTGEVKVAKQTAALSRYGVNERHLAVSDEDRDWFMAENRIDFALFDMVRGRSGAMSSALEAT
jgi:hypothetical protein